MEKPRWVLDKVVTVIHEQQIAEHGGSQGVRDPGLLASALARPKNMLAYSPSTANLASLAASYAFGIAKNHPFVDGNKRTALVVCRTFLRINGWELSATQDEKYDAFIRLAAGEMAEEELAQWIRQRLVAR